ncbi:MAG: hypothetical protein ACFFCP_03290 [Promethearchaeota archaeon]
MIKNRTRSLTLWIPLALAVVAYAFGDVLLKQGNIDLESTLESLFQGSFWIALLLSAPILAAFVFIMGSKLVMGVVLSKNQLGMSEGLFLALSVGLLTILGVAFFAETATTLQVIGLLLLMVGIVLVTDRKEVTRSSTQDEKIESNADA